MNIKEIISAWINKGYGSDEVYAIAKERRSICDNCIESTTMLGVEICGKCHCLLSVKTFTEENSCPLGKWVR